MTLCESSMHHVIFAVLIGPTMTEKHIRSSKIKLKSLKRFIYCEKPALGELWAFNEYAIYNIDLPNELPKTIPTLTHPTDECLNLIN